MYKESIYNVLLITFQVAFLALFFPLCLNCTYALAETTPRLMSAAFQIYIYKEKGC